MLHWPKLEPEVLCKVSIPPRFSSTWPTEKEVAAALARCLAAPSASLLRLTDDGVEAVFPPDIAVEHTKAAELAFQIFCADLKVPDNAGDVAVAYKAAVDAMTLYAIQADGLLELCDLFLSSSAGHGFLMRAEERALLLKGKVPKWKRHDQFPAV